MSKVHAITQSPEDIVSALGVEAKKAAATLVQTPTETINNMLTGLADALRQNAEAILSENQKDLDSARERGLTDAMIDRLALDEQRIEGMAQSVETVRQLDDPTGKTLWEENRPNGLKIQRISCPIGVFGMIYESRPNVTIDASILCLKSHSAVILRGGSESLHSSLALHKIIQNTLESFNLIPHPPGRTDHGEILWTADLRANGLDLLDITGITYNPLTKHYKLSRDIDVNYILHCTQQ